MSSRHPSAGGDDLIVGRITLVAGDLDALAVAVDDEGPALYSTAHVSTHTAVHCSAIANARVTGCSSRTVNGPVPPRSYPTVSVTPRCQSEPSPLTSTSNASTGTPAGKPASGGPPPHPPAGFCHVAAVRQEHLTGAGGKSGPASPAGEGSCSVAVRYRANPRGTPTRLRRPRTEPSLRDGLRPPWAGWLPRQAWPGVEAGRAGARTRRGRSGGRPAGRRGAGQAWAGS